MHTVSSNNRRPGSKSAALILLLAVSGCASLTQNVPPDIASTGTAFGVRSAGRMYQLFGDGYFEVGSYQIRGIHHDVSIGNELSIGQYSQASATGRFKFAISGPRSTWNALCDSRYQSRVIALQRVDLEASKSRLECELHSGNQQASLELHDENQGMYGTVRVGDKSYALRQYSSDSSNPRLAYAPTALGLRIDRGGQNVAALAFDHPGTFWLNGTLAPEQQDAFAAVLAALLINARH